MRPADKRLDRQGEKCYYLLGDTMKTKNLIVLALCVLICAAAIGAVRYMAEDAVLDNGGAASAPPVTTPDITPSPTPMPTPSPTPEPTPSPSPTPQPETDEVNLLTGVPGLSEEAVGKRPVAVMNSR